MTFGHGVIHFKNLNISEIWSTESNLFDQKLCPPSNGDGHLFCFSTRFSRAWLAGIVFARWPEGVGSLGGAGFGQTSPFSRVFARWPEGVGTWEGPALGTELSLYPDLSFLPCFCAVAGRRCGKPGRGGLWVQSYPFPDLSFLPCFCAMAVRCGKRGSGPWVQSYPLSRPLLSRMFLLGGGKCGKPGRGGLWVQSYLFPGLPHLSVIAQNTGKGGVWKGVTLWNSLPTCLKPGHRGKVCSWSSRLHVLASLSDANSLKKNSF